MSGTHKHKCDCGFVWEHGDECLDNVAAHTCAKCGKEEWFKFDGSEKVSPLDFLKKVMELFK